MPTPITFCVRPTPPFRLNSEKRVNPGVIWSSTASIADYAFDGRNLTATRAVTGTGGSQAQANIAAAQGYWEFKNAGTWAVGLTPQGAANNNWIGFIANSIGYHPTGTIYRNNVNFLPYAAFGIADTVMCCLKLVGATLYVFFGVNGAWQSGTDPSAGTGGIDVTALFSSAVPAVSANGVADAGTAAFTASSLAYAIPTGVTAWDGTSTTSAAITGSSTLTFTPSATLLGQGAVTGSSTLLLSPAATLTGTGAVSGSLTLTFTPSGTVTGRGAITGTSTLSFAPSGSLLGKGAISGSSSLTFTSSATLAGIGQIAGTAGLSFTPAGLLGGTGALTGSATLTLAGVGLVTSSNIWTVQPPAQGTWANDNAVAAIFDGVEFDPAIFDAPGAWSVVQPSTGTWG